MRESKRNATIWQGVDPLPNGCVLLLLNCADRARPPESASSRGGGSVTLSRTSWAASQCGRICGVAHLRVGAVVGIMFSWSAPINLGQRSIPRGS